MALVSAFLVPGSPWPLLRPQSLSCRSLAEGFARAAASLRASRPDVILIYSTKWETADSQQWLVGPHLSGTGDDLPFDMQIDVDAAKACLYGSKAVGVTSSAAADGEPPDVGSIVASRLLNPEGDIPVLVTSNNAACDSGMTERLGGYAVATASRLGRRVAVVGVGGMSGSLSDAPVDLEAEGFARAEDDEWNRRILKRMTDGEVYDLRVVMPDYISAARAEGSFKHYSFVLGGMMGVYDGIELYAYGAIAGAGAAIIEFKF